jgi:hypothetical protein
MRDERNPSASLPPRVKSGPNEGPTTCPLRASSRRQAPLCATRVSACVASSRKWSVRKEIADACKRELAEARAADEKKTAEKKAADADAA